MHTPTRRLLCRVSLPVVIAIISACSAVTTSPAGRTSGPATAAPTPSASNGRPTGGGIWGGVYSAAQADKGRDLYARLCASCHREDLRGMGHASPLVGEGFWKRWKDAPLGELYDRTRATMPLDAPGFFSAQEYADIISYVLQANQFPAGPSELQADPALMNQIIIREKAAQ